MINLLFKQYYVTGWWYQNEISHNITSEYKSDNPDKSWRIWYQDEIVTPEEYSYSQWLTRPKPTISILYNLLLKWDWDTIISFFAYPVYLNTPLKSYTIREMETKKKIKEYIFGQLFHLPLVELLTDLIYLICDFIYNTDEK